MRSQKNKVRSTRSQTSFVGLAQLGMTCALAGALVLAPATAFGVSGEALTHAMQSQETKGSVLSGDEQGNFEVKLAVAYPKTGTHAMYLLGESQDIEVTVEAFTLPRGEMTEALQGTVELFSGATLLGSAPVVLDADAPKQTVTISTDRWGRGGAHEVVARYTPDSETGYIATHSAAQTYRVVDTTRVVDDIELNGEPAAGIGEASLEWTIGNIWFSNFRVGFHREVIEGNVSLPDFAPGSSDEELQRYYWRPFIFHDGVGESDEAGNRIITFTGTARLTSGSGNQWNFTDPAMHINAVGDGYITAEFSGFYHIGISQQYEPTRVTIATFNGAKLATDAGGMTSATAELNWQGQSNGAGTWAHAFDASFPNEFVALLNPGVSLFFAESSIATDSSKVPHPIRFSFVETALAEEGDGDDDADPGSETPGGEEPGVENPGGEIPGGEEPGEEEPGGEDPDGEGGEGEEPGAEEPGGEGPDGEESEGEDPEEEAPEGETPDGETPGAVEPEEEAPVDGETGPETPGVGTPGTENPVAEAPNSENLAKSRPDAASSTGTPGAHELSETGGTPQVSTALAAATAVIAGLLMFVRRRDAR
ncbi:hypothetical protein [Leucobacter chinensis]|uniref:hypothetical protein n=1 Tax=Leucobacter chinensis TaxID=2851010 RepID=UPI001C23D1FD|nr:hypothetical protein [Leucobacter chinensis]